MILLAHLSNSDHGNTIQSIDSQNQAKDCFPCAMIEKLWEYFDQAFPPKPKFRIEDIPDLRGKVTVVTGMSERKYAV